jgi:hypothetical protein
MSWPWKVGILIFHVFYHMPTYPCEGQVDTRAEVRAKASPSYSLWIASNLCRSDCSPRVLLTIRAAIFNLTCTWKMWKIITWKVCQLSPPLPYSARLDEPPWWALETTRWHVEAFVPQAKENSLDLRCVTFSNRRPFRHEWFCQVPQREFLNTWI